MALAPPTNLEKAAILLRRLPPPSLSKVLEMLGVESAALLQKTMATVGNRSDLMALDEQILQEFREMQREVRESLRGSPVLERMHQGGGTTTPADSAAGATAQAAETEAGTEPPEEMDPIQELATFPPAILAAALRRETPRSIVLVLRELPTEFMGKVLEQFPVEDRQQLFMLLAQKSLVHPAVTQKVMKAVVVVCRNTDLSAASGEEDGRFKTLIGILQMVEREERLRLMEALTEQDEELATQIDDNLYDYSDILRIQDRSVQKLLTQLELKVVALALKTAPADIVEKVMKNLSERVRATLTEEMELLSSVQASKVEQARREFANVIRQQDKDGTLMWIEAPS